MSAPESVAIVGGSLAGLTVAESLRRLGYTGSITMIGEEPHHPYDRPPLSKQVLSGKWEPEKTMLRGSEQIEALGLDLRLGVLATAVDRERRRVTLSDGEEVGYDVLVAATGLRPRWLPMFRDMAGVHVLRTLEDCLGLQADFTPDRRVLVIGAGFLGTEIAATLRDLGATVSLVDVVTEPLTLQLGPELGMLVAELHQSRGVDLRVGVGVAEAASTDGRVSQVTLTDGSRLEVDLVVLAIGTVPATEWLEGTGLDLTGGLVCDTMCRAAADVYAVGDVARWPQRETGALLRVESRANAVEQAQAAAHNILAGPDAQEEYRPVNFGWTDQYDAKIQIYGHRTPVSQFCLLEGDPADGRFAGAYLHEGRITGVVGWNAVRMLRSYQKLPYTDADPGLGLEPYQPRIRRDDDDQALAGRG
jgi:NADPH-dependent 2,4-dienoyl-CoA reductase/sulfur reductase-like enzyme